MMSHSLPPVWETVEEKETKPVPPVKTTELSKKMANIRLHATDDEERVCYEHCSRIAKAFKLNYKMYSALEEFAVFSQEYLEYMHDWDEYDESEKKEFMVMDIARRPPGTFEKFSSLMKKYFNSTIMDDLLIATKRHVYPILADRPGYCLIINNHSFTKPWEWEERRGSFKDVNLFTDIFGKHLNYDVTVEFDQTKNKTLALLKDFAERKELADHDAFVAIIMSHGVKNHFITHDSEKVAFSEIYTIFGKEECPHLDGKPKTFIFNCCRVPEKKTPKPRPTRHVYKDYESDDYVDDEEKTKIFFGDTFVVFSTLDEYYSNRHTDEGSFFANAIFDTMVDKQNVMIETRLSHIVSKANQKLADENYLATIVSSQRARENIEPQGIEFQQHNNKKSFEFKHKHHFNR